MDFTWAKNVTVNHFTRNKRANTKNYEGLLANELAMAGRKNAKQINLEKYCDFLEFLYNNFDKQFMSIAVLVAIAKKKTLFENIPSRQSVYTWINLGLLNIKKSQLLRSSNKYKRASRNHHFMKRNKWHRVPIHLRPKAINQRQEMGHWEGDSTAKANNGSRIITLVERYSRFAITFGSPTQNMYRNYGLIKTKITNSGHLIR